MKKILLSLFVVSGMSLSAQVTVFEDSFENYDDFVISGFGGWQTLDIDMLNTYTGGNPAPMWANAGAPQAWQIFNPTTALVTNTTDPCTAATENANFDPHTGQKYAASWAGSPSTTGGAQANEDYLISPPISLGTSNNELTFWVKQLSTCYGAEKFKVGVYTGTGTPTTGSDFTIISGFSPVSTTEVWTLKTYPLAAYNNQTIRIMIKNQSADAYMLMVDDFKVTSSNLKTKEFAETNFGVSPNPVKSTLQLSNKANVKISQLQLTDLNGRIISTTSYNGVQQDINFDMGQLQSGVYLLNITSDKGTSVKKIIKQ